MRNLNLPPNITQNAPNVTPSIEEDRREEIARERHAELERERAKLQVEQAWVQHAQTQQVYFWDDQGREISISPQYRGYKMGFNLGQLITTLTNAGLTPQTAATAIQTLAVNSPSSSVISICNIILANANNPTVVKDECVKLAEIPNLPQSVAILIPSLASATDPVQVMNIVHQMEQNMRGANVFSFGGSGF